MCEKEKKEDSIFSENKYLLTKVLTVVIIFISMFFIIKFCFNTSLGDLGAVGDYFGGLLNPTFAFGALILLLHTIKIQSKELKASTEALKQQAKTSKDQLEESRGQAKEALEAQAKISAQQLFESTFFNLLQMHRQNVMSIEILSLDNFRDKKGVYVFLEIGNMIKEYFNDEYEEEIDKIYLHYFNHKKDKTEQGEIKKQIKGILNIINQIYYQIHEQNLELSSQELSSKMEFSLRHSDVGLEIKTVLDNMDIHKLTHEYYESPTTVSQQIHIKINGKLDNNIRQVIVSYMRSLDVIIKYIHNDDALDINTKKKFLILLFTSFSSYEIDAIYYMLPLLLLNNRYIDVTDMKNIIYEYELLNSPPEGFLGEPIHENLIKPLDEMV